MYLCVSFFSVAIIKHHDQSSLWTEFVLDSWFQKRLSWPGSKAASSRMVAGAERWEIISSNTRMKQRVTGSESEGLQTPCPLPPPGRLHLLHLPNSANNGEASVQMPKTTGDISHPNHHWLLLFFQILCVHSLFFFFQFIYWQCWGLNQDLALDRQVFYSWSILPDLASVYLLLSGKLWAKLTRATQVMFNWIANYT